MKRQIYLIIMMIVLACSRGFVAAQSTKTTSLNTYVTARSKPITLTQWINTTLPGSADKITEFRSPLKSLNDGNIFAEQYLTVMWRDLDIMRMVLGEYRQALIKTQSVVAIGGTNNACQGITNLDIVSLMSMSRAFQTRISNYSVLTGETFAPSSLDQSCIKRAACMGGDINQQVSNRTAAQDKRPLCSDKIAQAFLSLYDTELPKRTFDDIAQYNNIFVNNSLADSPFDIIVDMSELAGVQIDKVPEYIKWTELLSGSTRSGSTTNFALPDELIASTQQLLTALDLDTTVDPRTDDQIAALIGQFTTVTGTTATIPTGSILNACIDPTITTTTVQSLLQQLQTTQQATQQYNTSLNTDQTLNNVINGSMDPSSLAPQITRLSSLDTPARTIDPIVPVADLSANPLGAQLAQIQDDDLGSPGGGGTKLTGDPSGALGAGGTNTGVDTLKQCVSSCVQQYDNNNNSPCVIQCKAQGSIGGGLLDARACNQQCFNAKIACQADCLCSSTTTVAQNKAGTGQISKIHDMFEARRCVIPTNKLRNPQGSSCSRVDPITGMPQSPSAECLVGTVVEQGTNAREGGKGGLRINPKERFQLPNKFDLKKMIRFPIMLANSPLKNDRDKKKDIKTSQNKQEFATTITLAPALANVRGAADSYVIIQQFIDDQIGLWKQTQDLATASESIVSKPQ